MAPAVVVDQLERPLDNLRLSVTDRCNLRCAYCMPEQDYVWLPNEQILSFEELDVLVDRFIALGVSRVRLTGGEPLLRRDLPELVSLLAKKVQLRDLALTTNGVALAAHAQALKAAGLHRLTVSIDTLSATTFEALTRRDVHSAVLNGIHAAREAGFPLKLDSVVMRGVNDHELIALLDFAKSVNAELRFIEYMDVGGATKWKRDSVVSRAEIMERVARERGAIKTLERPASAPAERFMLENGQVFGVIASTTQPFCGQCDRARVTADGTFFSCLYATKGLDLKKPLRAGVSAHELEALIASKWSNRRDRGAEARLMLREQRGPLASHDELLKTPHLEMHTRGG